MCQKDRTALFSKTIPASKIDENNNNGFNLENEHSYEKVAP